MTSIIFGDSFIGPFKLLKDKKLKIYKFKGATLKGITKLENKNRKKIETVVSNSNNIRCLIFNFGQVDLYFSYYYAKFIQNKRFLMEGMIKKYVEFISNLKCKQCNKLIFGIFPNPIKDKHIFNTLLSYNILPENLINSIDKKEKDRLSLHNFRFKMYIKFNKIIEKYCNIYNIKYINFDDVLLNKNNRVKDEFIIKESIYNIHLLWEPLIPIILQKINLCGLKKEYINNINKSLNKYLNNKKREIKKKSKNKGKKLKKTKFTKKQKITYANKIE